MKIQEKASNLVQAWPHGRELPSSELHSGKLTVAMGNAHHLKMGV